VGLASVQRQVTDRQRRLDSLEEQFGWANGKPKTGLQIVCTRADIGLALDADTCVKLLEAYGFLPTGNAVTVIRLMDLPNHLNVEQTETYLREHGAEICGLRKT
jgi:hypothetical protein